MAADETVVVTKGWARSRAKLSPDDRKRVVAFEDRLLSSGLGNGHNAELIKACKERAFRSLRVSEELRAIVTIDPLVLLHVNHHDAAYEWARHTSTSIDPVTGTRVVFEAKEESPQPEPVDRDMFRAFGDDYLIETIGVPAAYVPVLRALRESSGLSDLEGRIPDEVLLRLMDVAEGRIPDLGGKADAPIENGFDGVPLTVATQERMEIMVSQPRYEWLEFASKRQRELAAESFTSPALITGPAGTGKTVVLLKRAAQRAQLNQSVLLVTNTKALAASLDRDIQLLAGGAEWKKQITTTHMYSLVTRLRNEAVEAGKPMPGKRIALGSDIERAILQVVTPEHPAHPRWYTDEWSLVVEPQGINSLEEYQTATRVGRKRALQRQERDRTWAVMEEALGSVAAAGGVPTILMASALVEELARQKREARGPISRWDNVLVDEYQDLTIPELRLLLAVSVKPGGLVMAGDTSQRLHKPVLELSALSEKLTRRRLNKSYRTTESIRHFAEDQLGLRDDDSRAVGISGKGATPEVHRFNSQDEHLGWVVERCKEWLGRGIEPVDIGVMAHRNEEVVHLLDGLRERGLAACDARHLGQDADGVRVLTYAMAKGLEFKAAIVCGVDDTVVSPAWLEYIDDEATRDEKAARLRNVLYVALTRAREDLVITCVGDCPTLLSDVEHVVHSSAPETIRDFLPEDIPF